MDSVTAAAILPRTSQDDLEARGSGLELGRYEASI